ncbi:MAG: hypothetical protein MRY32_08220 [Rickettsiales bacterium]|nr:hypothetical protein [Rickettsiales bacterium]
MLVTITKKPEYLKQASYSLLASGTTGSVWFEDEEIHESLGKQNRKKRPVVDA